MAALSGRSRAAGRLYLISILEGDFMRERVAVMSGVLACLLAATAFAQQAPKSEPGKVLAYSQTKGNCLACHGFPTLADAEQTGNSGPPLIAMQARFPDLKVLRAKIWDATASNPASFMPPFGKHGILSEEEIDRVVEFVYGL
jgi:sulfur-oxidizing protein SoxX